jgi:hypothetical protein
MAATKKTAVATAKVALPADYNDRVSADISAFKSRLSVAESNKIAVTQDKKFKLPSPNGDIVKVDTVAGVIVDFAAHMKYYESTYNKDETVPPNCFSVGFVAHNQLEPSANAPEAQADSCGSCSKAKFEKDAKGNWIPPECKARYVLAIIAADDNGDGKLMKIEISSTGTQAFDKYVRDLANAGKALYQVVTEFSFDPKRDYASVRCEKHSDAPQAAIAAAMAVRDEATGVVSQEPSTEGFEEKVAAKRLPSKRPRKAA